MKRTEKVLLIYTGGTIGMGCNPITGALEPLDFDHLADNVPEFKLIPTAIDTYQFIPAIDSSNMSPEFWAQIVSIIVEKYDYYDGFVILHGTDTMSYTASALSFMLENLTKPVILTGSQLPIGQLRTDGKENLMTSLELAAAHHHDGTPMVPEVCIYFNGHLLRGNRSTKQNADELNAFDSFNFPHLCEAGVSFNFQTHHILKPDYTKPMVPHLEMNSNVFVFSLFPGAEENIVKHILDAPELRGIVMRTYGSGNAPHTPWLMKLLKEASQRGVVTVNVSQCISGQADMNRYDTGYQLKDAGVVSGYDTTVEAALTKLMLLQAQYDDPEMVRQYMNKSIAGEITIPATLL
ncbi:L-asparaginase, type I [Prevotella disiens JCM 6334 = ATCC 29426]|uniref:asparaginase n=2 Tax=Prevotella disiens TaxID=28130 RepID=A0A379DYJ8_9BACT|nr:type I asparaginase [Prevotella disiens]ERJ80833.1 L-asparaginase, type I [Prevotella disiens JCM 6334 = ATCC 29426]SUB85495.1 L-asparaginase 1 [Prevotella disiens]